MSSPTNQDPHDLHYAPPAPVHHRRRAALTLLAVAALLALILAPRWGPPLWRTATLLYWQRKCLVYVPPDDQPAMRYEPLSERMQAVVPPPWQAFMGTFASGYARADGTPFVHERISPGGNRRLVGINLFAPGPFSPRNTGLQWEPLVVVPGTLLSGPKLVGPYQVKRLLGGSEPTLIFAATADPNDPSHFSFKCQQGSLTMLFDGWLRDDDSVVIEPRRSAATPPAPPSTASSP